MNGQAPRCWNCGYHLAGMRVEERCPECGADIWARPQRDAVGARRARHAMVWGIVSLVLFFLCLGPLSAGLAIPAVVIGGRVRRDVRHGVIPPEVAGGAGAGFWLGWIVIGLSVATLCIYGLFFSAMFVPIGVGPVLGP